MQKITFNLWKWIETLMPFFCRCTLSSIAKPSLNWKYFDLWKLFQYLIVRTIMHIFKTTKRITVMNSASLPKWGLSVWGVTGFESRGSLAFFRLYFFDFFTCSLPATIISLHARKYSKKEKKNQYFSHSCPQALVCLSNCATLTI